MQFKVIVIELCVSHLLQPLFVCRVRRSAVYFGDFKISDLNNVQRRKRFWKTAHETVHKYKKINKYNQCKISRQRNKLKSLNSLVDDLLKEKRISRSVTTSDSDCMLLNRKNRGGLIKPTRDVVKICMVAEGIIKTETNFFILI
ncbi:unnamed protein product [Acanthoscelides obtectus]|uniref:Uncharacterized protein n=1 Tax=Acanthoscelides obtectus TaxID=200917 RepID=A0A9P0KD67_ACAOB|nr:unnamed protein product [Acanthoscelides obtectus]CAK1635721.1 hypothetical protein AOBTE_LOCUS9462 [Acanthoscelides obtectus]